MKTSSTLSKKTNSAGCISIDIFSGKTTTSHLKINNSIRKSNPSGEKAVIINMFQDQNLNKNSGAQFTYIIKQEDDKRLNKNGVLRLYDMNEPIDIPVERLLGKWNSSHVGVTLIFSNNKWSLKNGNENLIIRHEPLLQIALQRFLKFVIA